MIVNIKLTEEGAVIPTLGSEKAAGADLYANLNTSGICIAPGETVMVSTGVAVSIPDDYAGLVYARSGIASKRGLAPANKVGVIDSDYTGTIYVALHNHSRQVQRIENHERIAQLVITPVILPEWNVVDELETTARGAGGFGSSGEN